MCLPSLCPWTDITATPSPVIARAPKAVKALFLLFSKLLCLFRAHLSEWCRSRTLNDSTIISLFFLFLSASLALHRVADQMAFCLGSLPHLFFSPSLFRQKVRSDFSRVFAHSIVFSAVEMPLPILAMHQLFWRCIVDGNIHSRNIDFKSMEPTGQLLYLDACQFSTPKPLWISCAPDPIVCKVATVLSSTFGQALDPAPQDRSRRRLYVHRERFLQHFSKGINSLGHGRYWWQGLSPALNVLPLASPVKAFSVSATMLNKRKDSGCYFSNKNSDSCN